MIGFLASPYHSNHEASPTTYRMNLSHRYGHLEVRAASGSKGFATKTPFRRSFSTIRRAVTTLPAMQTNQQGSLMAMTWRRDKKHSPGEAEDGTTAKPQSPIFFLKIESLLKTTKGCLCDSCGKHVLNLSLSFMFRV